MASQALFDLGLTYQLAFTNNNSFSGVAAGSDSAGAVIAVRWINTTYDLYVHRAFMRWITIVGFTAGQEVGLELMFATNFTVSYAGSGSAVAFATDSGKRWTLESTLVGSIGANASSNGAALTNGTHDNFGLPIARLDSFSPTGLQHTASVERQFTRSGVPPLRLAGNEGLVVRNLIGMGAAGTAKVTLELDVSLTPAT